MNLVIRPPRAEYSVENDLPGKLIPAALWAGCCKLLLTGAVCTGGSLDTPRSGRFVLEDQVFQRKDLELVGSNGNKLQCSHFAPAGWPWSEDEDECPKLPCVIYGHGNSGCRAEGNEAVFCLLNENITVFTLDFAGSGQSEGEYITLGETEAQDLKACVEYLHSRGHVSLIGLWGRSMGM